MRYLAIVLVWTTAIMGQVVDTGTRLGIGTEDPEALLHIDNTFEPYAEIMRATNTGTVYFHWVQRPDGTRGLCWFAGTYIALGNEYGNQDPQLRIVHKPDLGFTIFNALSYTDPALKHDLRFAASGELWLWATNGDDIWLRNGAVKFIGGLRFLGLISGTSPASLSIIPNSDDMAIYRDMASGDLSIVINDNGQLRSIRFN